MINEMKNSRSSDLLPMFYDCKYLKKKKKTKSISSSISSQVVNSSSSVIITIYGNWYIIIRYSPWSYLAPIIAQRQSRGSSPGYGGLVFLWSVTFLV